MSIVSSAPPFAAVARVVKALGAARGNVLGALSYAQSQPAWRSTPQTLIHLQALVDMVDTSDIISSPVAVELAQYLRPLTLVGKLPLRRVPFRTRLIIGSAGARAAWVREGRPTPASDAGYDAGSTLEHLRVGTIAVLSSELVRVAKPAAETTIAAELADAIVPELDRSFIDPTFTGEAGVSPASITAGATQIVSSGSDVASIDADVERLLDALIAQGMTLQSAWWCMAQSTAARLSSLRSAGQLAYPGINARTGGVLAGLPVALSGACTSPASPSESSITLLECGEVMLADDSEASIDYSANTALQMTDSPSSAAAQLTSVWQANNVAIKAQRYCNWQARRPGVAAVLTNVQF